MAGKKRKPDGVIPTDPLDKMLKEPLVRHRGFLLYAMMDENQRSFRRVADALARGDATIRRWSETFRWMARIDAVGAPVQQLALRKYTERYPGTLVADAAVIESRMSIPFRPMGPPPPANLAEVPGASPNPAGPAGAAKIARDIARGTDEAKLERSAGDRFARLLEAMLGRAAQQVASGKMKVNARDVPGLIRAHQEMAAILEGRTTGNGGVAAEPSIRVVQALNRNESPTQAMLDDAWECVAVLQGIKNSQAVAREMAAASAREDEAEEQAGPVASDEAAG